MNENVNGSLPSDEYFVKDLGEAAALLTQSIKLIHLEKDASNFFWFVFQNKTLCETIANNFWSGDLSVSAKAYNDALRNLKDRLFSQR